MVEDKHKMKKVLPDKTTNFTIFGRVDWADKTLDAPVWPAYV